MVLVALLSLALATSAVAQDGSLLQYRGGPERPGTYRAPAVDHYGGLDWRFQTGGPIASTPAVWESVAYVGSGDGHLYALNAATGEELWRHYSGSAVHSSPAVVGERVIYQTMAGKIAALDRSTGEELWVIETGEPLEWPWGWEDFELHASSPAVAGGAVYIGAMDGGLLRLDPRTGEVVWRYQTDGRIAGSPAVSEGRVIVGAADGRVYAVDAASGGELWVYETLGASLNTADFGFDRRTIQASPAVSDGRVIVGARDGKIYALDIETGDLIWRASHETSWILGAVAVDGDQVFAASSDGGFVQALSAADGSEQWRRSTGGRQSWFSPVVLDSIAYFGDGSGRVYALHRRNGDVIWSERFGTNVLASLVPYDGSLLLGSGDGALYSIRGGDRPLRRMIYWDSTYVQFNLASDGSLVEELPSYELVDRSSLIRHMRSSDAMIESSVVVFAMDYLPPSDTTLLRAFLNQGGSVVWIGQPPFVWGRDEQGNRSMFLIHRDLASRTIGVDYSQSAYQMRGAMRLDAGRSMGLPELWYGMWAVDSSSVTEVYGVDDLGLAAVWRKRYPGGGAFTKVVPIPDASTLRWAAEIR